jgi:hypothetical protein
MKMKKRSVYHNKYDSHCIKTLTPEFPSMDFFYYKFCDIVKFSIIPKKIYTNLAYTIYKSKKILKPFYI